ncbi:MAG TPA: hypothetical protein VNE42_01890 [Acidimicrobiales bacterium]|nr:hypothetical protein [Acidimicrobiales bacterium]
MTTIVKWNRAFRMFWWDFLVGDTPELFVGMVLVVGSAFLVHDHRALAAVPTIAVLVLIASTIRD